MDYNSRKTGTVGSSLVSSKDSPRSTPESLKTGRLATTALGRTSKEKYSHNSKSGDHGVKRSHDHFKSSASKEPIGNDHVKSKPVINPPPMKTKVNQVDRKYSSTENVGTTPQVTSEKVLHRLKDNREREILNQSLKRTLKATVGGEDSKHRLKDENTERDVNQTLKRTKVLTSGEDLKGQHRVKDDRERDILNQSLKRTKVLTGGEDSKHRSSTDERKRDILNQSLKRSQVRDAEVDSLKMVKRPKGQRLEADTKTVPQVTDSKVRHEKPRPSSESLKLKTPAATKPQHVTGDGQKVVKKETSKELPQVKSKDHNERTAKSVVKPTNVTTAPSRKQEDVKKKNVSDDRKRVKLEDGKDVRVRSVTKIEPVIATKNSTSKNGSTAPKETLRSVKMVTGTVMKAKQEKLKKKVFSLPGQRFEPPEERDALRLFYGSLHKQIPTSDMANIWLMEHGLLEADEAQKVLNHKVKSKTGSVSKASPYQAPTPSRFSNGSAGKSSKLKNEGLLDIKPFSKKLKL